MNLQRQILNWMKFGIVNYFTNKEFNRNVNRKFSY